MALTEVQKTDRAVTWCKAAGLEGEACELAAFALGVVPSRTPMRRRDVIPTAVADLPVLRHRLRKATQHTKRT